ncbi:Alpha-(1,6)-fucosyltransferase [Sparganum proliferum]
MSPQNHMMPAKAARAILCITLLFICLLWRLSFTWLIDWHRSQTEKVVFHYPTPTEREPQKTDGLMRQARSILNELWRLNNAYFPTRNQASPPAVRLNSLLSQATLQLTARLDLLDKLNGRRESRRQEVDVLSSELRHQISSLQNPSDCSRSRFTLAELRYSCGFGCTAHHMALKFSFAFATNRTLLLQHNDWKDFFLPFSNCSLKHAEGQSDIPHIENGLSSETKRYYPPAIPGKWAEELRGALGDPSAWYRGHLLGYILRPRDLAVRRELEMEVQNMRRCQDGPIASIHVRRTDKLASEAEFHALEEYMFHVEHFFDLKEVEYGLKTGNANPPSWSWRRRVFLASDDSSVFQEAKSRYPRYEFIGRQREGSAYKNRWSTAGVLAILVDLHLLVSSDFLVCTGSSNVCRLAYELLSTKSPIRGDAAFQMQSVDQMYQSSHTQRRWWRAIADFKQEDFNLGDYVSIQSTQWDGFAKTALRLHAAHDITVPAYLFQEVVQTIP